MNPHYREIPQASYLLIKLLFFLQESKYIKTLPKINIYLKKKAMKNLKLKTNKQKTPHLCLRKITKSEICALNMGRAGK